MCRVYDKQINMAIKRYKPTKISAELCTGIGPRGPKSPEGYPLKSEAVFPSECAPHPKPEPHQIQRGPHRYRCGVACMGGQDEQGLL